MPCLDLRPHPRYGERGQPRDGTRARKCGAESARELLRAGETIVAAPGHLVAGNSLLRASRSQWDKALPCPSEQSSDFFPPRSVLFSPVTQTVEQPSRLPCPHSWGHVCPRVSQPIPPRRHRGMSSAETCLGGAAFSLPIRAKLGLFFFRASASRPLCRVSHPVPPRSSSVTPHSALISAPPLRLRGESHPSNSTPPLP